jgi:hypothetical protein
MPHPTRIIKRLMEPILDITCRTSSLPTCPYDSRKIRQGLAPGPTKLNSAAGLPPLENLGDRPGPLRTILFTLAWRRKQLLHSPMPDLAGYDVELGQAGVPPHSMLGFLTWSWGSWASWHCDQSARNAWATAGAANNTASSHSLNSLTAAIFTRIVPSGKNVAGSTTPENGSAGREPIWAANSL